MYFLAALHHYRVANLFHFNVSVEEIEQKPSEFTFLLVLPSMHDVISSISHKIEASQLQASTLNA